MSAQPERRAMQPGRRVTDVELCMLSVRMTTDLYDTLYALSKRYGLSISDTVRLIVRNAAMRDTNIGV
jgi:hypothetical protein